MVVLAPPGSSFGSKLEAIGAAIPAKVFNVNQLAKEAGLAEVDFSQAPDAKIMPLVDTLQTDLKDKDFHRLLFGYPRNLTQIHHLRKLSLYPHKVFVVNCDRAACASRLSQKLFGKDQPSSVEERHKVESVLQEYEL